MKKIFKSIICIILSFSIMLTLCGCTVMQNIVDELYGNEFVSQVQSVARIAFSEGAFEEEFIPITLDEFEEYEVKNSHLRSSLAYDTLSEKQKNVYRAFEYAMENGYNNIFIDDIIIEDENTLIDILNYLSLDSPLLEENLRYAVGNFESDFEISVLGLYNRKVVFDGCYITVYNFTKDWWSKKQEALQKANEIINTLPDNLTDMEKAYKLFSYVTNNVEYFNYENLTDSQTVYPFLYDALIVGKTNCDGFSNALALLYRLAGIENAEKMFEPENTQEAGHVWNIFSVDGKWYNADATNATESPLKADIYNAIDFAFGDELQTYKPTYAEIYPACNEGAYISIDARLSDASSKDFVTAVKNAFKAHGNKWALILLDSFDEAQLDKALQRLADNTQRNINSIYFECIDGRTAVYIY